MVQEGGEHRQRQLSQRCGATQISVRMSIRVRMGIRVRMSIRVKMKIRVRMSIRVATKIRVRKGAGRRDVCQSSCTIDPTDM